MKRILALLLCLVTVFMCLVACGDNTDSTGGGSGNTADRPNLTLKIAVIVDDKTTDEGIAAMQTAFNNASSLALSTKAEFVCFKANEYQEKMQAEMERLETADDSDDREAEDNKANGTASDESSSVNTYPAASKTQFDIVIITGEDMYNQYVEEGWIVSLSDAMMNTYSKLATKVIDSAMNMTLLGDDPADTKNSKCYAIPTAKAYGEYTYLSVNKQFLKEYNISENTIDSLADVYTLFTTMQANEASMADAIERIKTKNGYTSFAPVLNTYEDFEHPNARFLSQLSDNSSTVGDDFSLMGMMFDRNDTYLNWSVEQQKLVAINLLTDPEYSRFFTMKLDLKLNNCYSETGTEEDYIIGIVKGDYGMRNSNEDYYYLPLLNPTVEREEVFQTMLAVSSFTVNQDRAVEMIQELMTDDTKSGLLNIMLYGVENENYYFEDGAVSFRNSSTYGVHKDYRVGNLREVAYSCADYGEKADTLSNALLQNSDLTAVLLDSTFQRPFGMVNKTEWAAIDAASEAYLAELEGCTTQAELRQTVADIVAETTSAEGIGALVAKHTDSAIQGTLANALDTYFLSKFN